MTLLAGFLDVLLRGFGSVGFAAAVGGLVYAVLVLRPFSDLPVLGRTALRSALSLVAIGAGVLAVTQAALSFVIHPWALADANGHWPIGEFLDTEIGRAGLLRILLAGALLAATIRLARRPASRGRS